MSLFKYDLSKVEGIVNKKWLENQKLSSLLAHEAIHNVFGLIDPQYLTLKPHDEKLTEDNSLGMDSYRNLLQFGFWKKLVYITQTQTALDLCYKFNNYEHFQIIKKNFINQDNISEAQ